MGKGEYFPFKKYIKYYTKFSFHSTIIYAFPYNKLLNFIYFLYFIVYKSKDQ